MLLMNVLLYFNFRLTVLEVEQSDGHFHFHWEPIDHLKQFGHYYDEYLDEYRLKTKLYNII